MTGLLDRLKRLVVVLYFLVANVDSIKLISSLSDVPTVRTSSSSCEQFYTLTMLS
jgi:predicted transcriptional regulator